MTKLDTASTSIDAAWEAGTATRLSRDNRSRSRVGIPVGRFRYPLQLFVPQNLHDFELFSPDDSVERHST